MDERFPTPWTWITTTGNRMQTLVRDANGNDVCKVYGETRREAEDAASLICLTTDHGPCIPLESAQTMAKTSVERKAVIDTIWYLLDGEEWDSDTLDAIAHVVTEATGRRPADPDRACEGCGCKCD